MSSQMMVGLSQGSPEEKTNILLDDQEVDAPSGTLHSFVERGCPALSVVTDRYVMARNWYWHIGNRVDPCEWLIKFGWQSFKFDMDLENPQRDSTLPQANEDNEESYGPQRSITAPTSKIWCVTDIDKSYVEEETVVVLNYDIETKNWEKAVAVIGLIRRNMKQVWQDFKAVLIRKLNWEEAKQQLRIGRNYGNPKTFRQDS